MKHLIQVKETSMSYVMNAWYAACWSDEVKQGEMSHRTLLDEQIVFYRNAAGNPVALRDRCPHRFVPLHMGRLRGDVIECGYHGLQFDCSGACVKNPHGDGKIPAAAKVKSYPVVDRHTLLWVWMGEPAEADPSLIPDYSLLDNKDGFVTSRGYIVMNAGYELMGENLLDLSHVAYLHEGLLGTAGMAAAMPKLREEGVRRLWVDRWMPNVDVPKVFDMLFRQDGKPVDAWQNMRFDAPSNFLVDAGVHAPGESRERGAGYFGIHILTPLTKGQTHYHFAAARPQGQELDSQTAEKLSQLRRFVFEEQDKPIVDAQQAAIGDADFWSLKPVLLPIDSGPVRMRRMLERMLKEEAEQRQGVAGTV
jgi:phenylpropionate dioxygenase-like ring-hydroxylating dioxygenase large terminal subunit